MSARFLIIDDDAADQKILKRGLNKEGFSDVFIAESGEEGVSMVQENKPDIVLVDTQLPGINGFETCEKIKDLNGGNIKVIVMTGFIEAINATKAREAGADDYCAKTSDCAHLMGAIKKFV